MAEDYFGIVGTIQAGAYRVEKVVAEGGFGVVYRAYHDVFQSAVALKCLKMPGQISPEQQAEFLAQFKAEAAMLFRLSASIPAVVRPLHVDKIITPDNRFVPFMALEWLEGEGLDALIARRQSQGKPPLGLKKAVRVLAPVARALARAHHFPTPEGPIAIVHRDIKPDNIFIAKVNGEEVIKIFDFGIAKARSVASQVAGRLSQNAGQMAAFTPGYGAPEQWLPKRFGQTGPWTDVFGLALTVLELATSRPIIDGDNAAMMGTACDEKRRPTPRNEGLEVSDDVEAVFLSALAVDPRDRYPDAGKFWDALESSLGLDLSATPTIATSGRSIEENSSVVSLPELMANDAMLRTAGGSPISAAAHAASPGAGRAPNRFALAELEAPEVPGGGPSIELDLPAASKRGGSPQSSRGASDPGPHSNRSGSYASVREGAPSPSKVALIEPSGSAKQGDARSPRSRDALGSGQYPRAAGEHGSRGRPSAPKPKVQVSLLSRIKVPLAVGGVGMVLALLDQVVLLATNSSVAVGPVRLTYFAALLTVIGVILVMKRLIVPDDDR